MPRVEKDVLRPGTYTLRDGSKHTFTEQDVRSCVANGRKMLAVNQSAPLIWEHDLDAVPTPLHTLLSGIGVRDKAAGWARHCFGHAVDFDLRIEDGKPVAYMVNDIPDEDDAKRWKAARYCSPRIDRNYCDGAGRVYSGASITHLAATPKPIQTNQFPVMLSALPGKKVPFRGTTTILLAEGEPNMPKDANGEEVVADDAPPKTETPPPPKDEPPANTGGTTPMADNAKIGRLKNALAMMTINLPDSATDLDSICISLEAIAANGGIDNGDDDYDLGGGDDPSAQAGNSPNLANTAPQGAPMMMSAMATAGEAKVVNGYRKQLIARVERLCQRGMESGMMDGVQAKELERKVTGAQLSLTEAGDMARSDLITEIEIWERVTGNAAKINKRGRNRFVRQAAGANLSALGAVVIPNPGNAPEISEAVAAAAKATSERLSRLPAATIPK